MSKRLKELERWLQRSCGLSHFSLAPASADASFRHYFRVTFGDGKTLIAMDAPPDKEDCRPFVAIAERLSGAGLHVPTIHASDIGQGFLLLEDLGSRSYLDHLDVQSADTLYGDAMAALLQMQKAAAIDELPSYDRSMLLGEIKLFPEWLLAEHLGLCLSEDERDMLDSIFESLVQNALAQPVVFVHRDYHSRNLMVLNARNPGVIDFQDAVAGPVTYDLVSLLRDCYIAWPQQRLEAWLSDYFDAASEVSLLAGSDMQTFRAWFDLMGVQRHLKAAGIFARLCHRDGKSGYLADIPRTLNYIIELGSQYKDVADMADFLRLRVLPKL